MNKIVLFIFSLSLFFLLSQHSVFAESSSCQIIYGGGQACPQNVSFTIKKEVQKPNSSTYVSDLSVNDPKFQANSTVNFRITVKNTGSAAISNMQIVDTLPQFMNFVSGGTANGRTVTINVPSLGAGQSKSFPLIAKVTDSSLLPQDKGTICVFNKAKANVNGTSAEDSSQLCITRQVLGAVPTPQVITTTTTTPTSTPSSGPEMLPLMGLVASGITGLILRKKASK